MAASPLLLRLRQKLLPGVYTRRRWFTAADFTRSEENSAGTDNSPATPTVEDGYGHRPVVQNYARLGTSERRERKEIWREVEPMVSLAKEILHARGYADGECLGRDDEKAVIDKLLAYHPKAQEKIGIGIHSIIVDRHPKYKESRCFFVMRVSFECIDFSYKKCIREYIRRKYPTHVEMFSNKPLTGKAFGHLENLYICSV